MKEASVEVLKPIPAIDDMGRAPPSTNRSLDCWQGPLVLKSDYLFLVK